MRGNPEVYVVVRSGDCRVVPKCVREALAFVEKTPRSAVVLKNEVSLKDRLGRSSRHAPNDPRVDTVEMLETTRYQNIAEPCQLHFRIDRWSMCQKKKPRFKRHMIKKCTWAKLHPTKESSTADLHVYYSPNPWLRRMISALYVLHRPDISLPFLQIDLLIHRRYHNDVPDYQVLLETFCMANAHKLPQEMSPFLLVNGVSYIHIRGDEDIILLAVSRQNANAMLTVVFLQDMYRLFYRYLIHTELHNAINSQRTDLLVGTTERTTIALDRDVLSDNTNLIHELLDECMDFGIIQTTDYNILKEYIKVEANLSTSAHVESDSSSSSTDDEATGARHDEIKKKKKKKKSTKRSAKELKAIKSTHNQAIKMHEIEEQMYINSSVLRTTSLAINWRPKGIFYAKNEIYIDLIEDCDFVFDLSSEVITKNDIMGRCEVKCYLSGMPRCKVEFNEKQISGIVNDDVFEDTVNQMEGNQLTVAEEPEVAEEDGEDTDRPAANLQRKHKQIPIRNIQFHQCIELGSLYKNNQITFTPPDQKFTLLTYHVEQQKQTRKLPLIKLKPTYKIFRSSNALQIMCTLSTQFKKRLHTQNLVVRIPVDPKLFPIDNTGSLRFKAQVGEVTFQVDTSQLLWQIGELKGGENDIKMMAELQLTLVPTVEAVANVINRRFENNAVKSSAMDDANEASDELDKYYGVNKSTQSHQPVQARFTSDGLFVNELKVSFVIPMLSYSGLKLVFLKVDEEQMNYTSFPWVRYMTESGNTQGRSAYRFKLGIDCFVFG